MIENGILGHSFKGGWVQYQFEIIELLETDSRPMARVQMYSWVTGCPTTIEQFPQKWVVENCDLYETELDWRTNGERLSQMASAYRWSKK